MLEPSKVKVLVTQLCPTLCDTMDYLSLEFYRQEYWSGLQFPSPGDLPNPGIEPNSPNLLEAPLEPPNVLLISGDLGAPQLILMNSQS